MHRYGAQGLMWGARGPFFPAAAMVVAVVTPVVIVLGLLKITKKTLLLVVYKQCLYLLLCIVKHITTHVMLIVVWPKPEPLWANGTLTYWVWPESFKHHQDGHIIITWPQHMNKRKPVFFDFWRVA
jgi:hypothetical protein